MPFLLRFGQRESRITVVAQAALEELPQLEVMLPQVAGIVPAPGDFS